LSPERAGEVVEETGDAEKRRESPQVGGVPLGSDAFWVYALVLAGIVLLALWLA
jgi:hypothetical protein